MRPELPNHVAPISGNAGIIAFEWYTFMVLLMAHIDALEARIQALEDA